MQGRVRRIHVPRHCTEPQMSGGAPDDVAASAFALALENHALPRSAEQWARAVFEGAPALLRWAIVLGWRFFLLLRLQPLDAPEHVLGWRLERTVAGTGTDTVSLAADSPLLRAENVVGVDGNVVVWVTIVHLESQAGRLLWRVASTLHEVLIPYLLGRAARANASEVWAGVR